MDAEIILAISALVTAVATAAVGLRQLSRNAEKINGLGQQYMKLEADLMACIRQRQALERENSLLRQALDAAERHRDD